MMPQYSEGYGKHTVSLPDGCYLKRGCLLNIGHQTIRGQTIRGQTIRGQIPISRLTRAIYGLRQSTPTLNAKPRQGRSPNRRRSAAPFPHRLNRWGGKLAL